MKLKLTWLLTLFMAFVMQFSFAQEKTVTGTVTVESDGLPLPGATVIVAGTSRGTQTDFDGKYSISAEVGSILEISYVGYKTAKITVGGADVYDVSLKSDNALEEVVVTGYVNKAKEKSTSAVSVVSASEVQDIPIATFEQLLQGRAAGVQISSGSGQPGSVAAVTIRGQNSINGNTTPLYIVDGLQIDGASFASLNPNDFETFSILKDAQAKSLYGARAAAGVIVITTKRGRAGSKPLIQYRTYTGWSEAPELNVGILNAQQFYEQSRLYGVNGAGGLSDQDITNLVNDLGGFDVRDALVRTGRTTNHEFNVSGGSEKIQYFTSAAYFEQEGTVIGSDLQRMTTRVNLTYNATDKLRIDLRSNLGFSRLNVPVSNGGVTTANPFLVAFTGNPITPAFNEDGSFNSGGGLSRVLPNILEDISTGLRETEELKIIASANVNYQFNEQWSANYNIGVDFEDDFQVVAASPESFRGRTGAALGDGGSQTEQNRRDMFFTSTLKLQYQNTFADKHSVTVAGFVEAVKRDFRSSNFTGFQLEPNLVGFASAITPGTVDNELIPTVSGGITRTGLFSIFANGSYDYDSRYGVDFGVRRDQSSRVASENTSAAFYSVGVRWNINNEAFMSDVDWINSLKLRASFGTSGNDASVGSNAAFQQLGLGLFQGEQQLVRAGLANENISWEIQEDLNIGLDFGLFNNKLVGTVEWYKNVTRDLIIPFNISAAFGAGVVNDNAGTLENSGVEVELSYNLVQTEDWFVNLNFNGAYNYGVVTDLGDQVDQFETGTSIVRVGEQLGSQFVVPFVGVNPVNGDPLYLDLDGNVTSQFSDSFARTGFGSSIPLYQGGFGFDIGWKGFSLNTLFVYQAEMTRFNNTSFFMENLNFLGSGLNQAVTILDAWQQPGDITNVPRLTANREFSSADLEPADFLRLRNIQLAYTFSSETMETLPLSGLRIYATGVNLLTFTKFTGLDPEDSNNITSFEYPNPRTITVGVDVTF